MFLVKTQNGRLVFSAVSIALGTVGAIVGSWVADKSQCYSLLFSNKDTDGMFDELVDEHCGCGGRHFRQ